MCIRDRPTLPQPVAAQRQKQDIHALANPPQTRFYPQSQMLHKGKAPTRHSRSREPSADKISSPKPDAAQKRQRDIHALANPLHRRFRPQSRMLHKGVNKTSTLLRSLSRQRFHPQRQMLHKGINETFALLRTRCRQDCTPKRPQPTLPQPVAAQRQWGP